MNIVDDNVHIRDAISEFPREPAGGKYLKLLSWNINGLRALATKNIHVLQHLVSTLQPDII